MDPTANLDPLDHEQVGVWGVEVASTIDLPAHYQLPCSAACLGEADS